MERPTLPPMPDGAPPEKQQVGDVVLRLLMGLHLVEQESEYRSILENAAVDPDNPTTRDLTVAVVVLLMSMGGVSWPILMRVINQLRRLGDDDIREGAVAIMNGSHLMLPDKGDRVKILDMGTLREVDKDPPPSLVSTIYSATSIWAQVEKILK